MNPCENYREVGGTERFPNSNFPRLQKERGTWFLEAAGLYTGHTTASRAWYLAGLDPRLHRFLVQKRYSGWLT